MIRQAVILAGGRGTRLGRHTQDMPKPLLDVAGRPFLWYLLWNLRRHGIDQIVLSVGYLADRFQEALQGPHYDGLEFTLVREREPLGTGGALRNTLPHLEEEFLVLNGDTLFDFNYRDLEQLLRERDGAFAMALRRVPDVSRFGSVEIDGSHVSSFNEKVGSGPGLISGGVYCVRRQVVERMPEGQSSIEQDLLPSLVKSKNVVARPYDGFFLDIGLPETLEAAQTALPAWRRKGAVFLDRDGVLNVDHGYVHTIESFEWIDGARAAVKHINDLGRLAILVTNQAGIARGYYDHSAFHRLMQLVQRQLAEVGAHLDAVYYCPHHPTEGDSPLTGPCECRKPKTGMIEQACRDFDIDLSASCMIGDSAKDMETAEAAGVQGFRFAGDELYRFIRTVFAQPAEHGVNRSEMA